MERQKYINGKTVYIDKGKGSAKIRSHARICDITINRQNSCGRKIILAAQQ